MLRQILFWTLAGPKHLQRFLLLWLILMGLCFYAFVHEAFDRSAGHTIPPGLPAPPASNR